MIILLIAGKGIPNQHGRLLRNHLQRLTRQGVGLCPKIGHRIGEDIVQSSAFESSTDRSKPEVFVGTESSN